MSVNERQFFKSVGRGGGYVCTSLAAVPKCVVITSVNTGCHHFFEWGSLLGTSGFNHTEKLKFLSLTRTA